MKTTRIAQ
jgi:hypothetical protein